MSESISIQEYNKLVKTKKRQPEGQLQSTLGRKLNGIWKLRLNPNLVYWTYSGAGEKKPIMTAVMQKRKGLKKGDFDYRFEINKKGFLHLVYLELKSTKGSLTKDQKIFLERHEGLKNVAIGSAKDMKEIEEFLVTNEVFINE